MKTGEGKTSPFIVEETDVDAQTSVVLVAVLGLIGNVIGSYLANSKTTAVMQEQIRDVKEDITVLSSRVDKHNNLIERMAKVEVSVASAHKRLDDFGVPHSKE